MSKGLEAWERIKKGIDTNVWQSGYWDDIDIIEKELKALEIIKEKPQATLWLFQHCDKEMEYEDMISLFKEDITKKQFELLKEVLL